MSAPTPHSPPPEHEVDVVEAIVPMMPVVLPVVLLVWLCYRVQEEPSDRGPPRMVRRWTHHGTLRCS